MYCTSSTLKIGDVIIINKLWCNDFVKAEVLSKLLALSTLCLRVDTTNFQNQQVTIPF